ncbi:MAG: preprotein translocase subunit SecY [candidate division Zixibacteria bacterium RBG_16_53_22]|nr:MAG: preprotein translocase subunit SecY [candidate division Zixibacteria bacterium RBG_16_53_22]
MALDSIRNIFKIHELRQRIFFTLGLLVVYRIGGHIPTPGVDLRAIEQFDPGGLLGLFDLFVGGAFTKVTIFSLGIMPYISASIIIQLLGAVIPFFQRLQKEGEEGRRKITQYTRYGTVLIAATQAMATAIFLSEQTNPSLLLTGVSKVNFILMTILTFTSGTIFIMWLGERITERGIGNGISLIIFIGIIARLPTAVIDELQKFFPGFFGLTGAPRGNIIKELLIIALMVIIIAAVVLVTRSQRRIPVQYAKRVVGRKVYGGTSTHIPLSVNTAGIIPIIFAQSIMFAPQTVFSFFPDSDFMVTLSTWFNPTAPLYMIFYALLIIFFAYFYTAIVFNPVDLADNMKKQGGFIPGIRPGQRTAEYIDRVLTRITLPGALFFAIIAIMPNIMSRVSDVQFYFGGTGLLIVVGVALDTLQQIESHLLMRHYDGFMKKGRLRGRYS